ncbi:MAG: hypothetical protein ACKO45_10400 [Cyanobium sp.]
MFQALDAKDKVIDFLIEALEFNHLDAIRKDMTLCGTAGKEIASHCDVASNLDEGVKKLFDKCQEVPKGLVCLRHVSYRYFRRPELKDKFFSLLSDYARLDDSLLDDDKRELVQNRYSSDTDSHQGLAFVDDYSLEELDKARKVFMLLSKSGKPFHGESNLWPIPPTPAEEQRAFLKARLSSRPQAATEEFIQEMKRFRDTSQVFLLVLVEKTRSGQSPYQFRHEIIEDEDASREPAQLNEQRTDQGEYSTGTIDDFGRIVGRWIQAARQAYPKFCLEIFLPFDLLIASESLHVEIPEGNRMTKVPLWASGTPTVIRPLCRAEKRAQKYDEPRQRSIHSLFSDKWSTLARGGGLMHSVCNQQQIKPLFLRPRLSSQNLVGAIMLIDLPLDLNDRLFLFTEVVDNGLPFFAWWRPRGDQPASLAIDSANLTATRLRNLADLLEMTEIADLSDSQLAHPELDLDDFPAPSHLHAMESVGEKLISCAGRQGKQWVHDLWVIVDHPNRWPQLIFYEEQPGGDLRSPL